MAKENYSNQVCELLAKQLVEEQAEVMKHEAVVDNIKQTIVDKKVAIIKGILLHRAVKLDGGVYYLSEIYSHIDGTTFTIEIGLVISLSSISRNYTLSPREKVLVKEYEERFPYYISDLNNYHEEIFGMMRKMVRMKNRINLSTGIHRTFRFDDATDPNFFKKTGIVMGSYDGISSREVMIEDCRIRMF